MQIDFTVVIPTYRRPELLKGAIKSALTQEGVTLEVLVADDCPDASARDAVRALSDPRVQYQLNPRPTGGNPSVVRNLTWPNANGRYIHFLDDDDIVPQGHYAAAKAAFAAYPGVGLVFGRVEPFGSCPPTQLQHEEQYFANAARNASACGRFGRKLAFASRTLFGPAMVVCSAGVVRRECLERIDGFDSKMRLLEDSDFFLRMMRQCGAVFLDRPAVHYRIGYPSLMHCPDPPPEQLRLLRAARRHMQWKYRKERGPAEFYALALLSRTLLRVV